MPKTFEDPNPHISILDDPQTKKQIANLARHALDVADRMKMASPPSEEQAERERFAAMSNRAAEENPLYAAVRDRPTSSFFRLSLAASSPLSTSPRPRGMTASFTSGGRPGPTRTLASCSAASAACSPFRWITSPLG
jgi:hypothetical protein